jgi:hypothetical protein
MKLGYGSGCYVQEDRRRDSIYSWFRLYQASTLWLVSDRKLAMEDEAATPARIAIASKKANSKKPQRTPSFSSCPGFLQPITLLRRKDEGNPISRLIGRKAEEGKQPREKQNRPNKGTKRRKTNDK